MGFIDFISFSGFIIINMRIYRKNSAASTLGVEGIDEAELLLGIKDIDKVADYFSSQGSTIVAIKLGPKGCYLRHQSEELFVPGYSVGNVIDTVAGDGFAAGLLAGILRNESLERSGKYANGVGAMADQKYIDRRKKDNYYYN
ncbi:PfkB family carbohydrate kinase [Desulfosporosinus sp. FKA]|uniref:carbohydrate kinase family protein n=1 Tax=Desulfosporosinus sp. FKA TaxID=1969834 RepID=UPI001FA894BF|nr:PfkB family carbohydrate kinase [Desulfosporosinus sp. FKA]